jgi:hypothetical protein
MPWLPWMQMGTTPGSLPEVDDQLRVALPAPEAEPDDVLNCSGGDTLTHHQQSQVDVRVSGYDGTHGMYPPFFPFSDFI